MSLKAKILPKFFPAVLAAVLAAGGGSYALMDAGVPVLEGNPIKAYADIGGVPTICGGVTEGVKLGDVETVEGCRKRNAKAINIGLAAVKRCAVTPKPMPESMIGAWGLFAYNVGNGNFCGSTAVKLLRAGKFAEACAQLPRWRYVAGKDCAIAANKCRGIVERRAIEQAMCEYDL